MPQGIAEKKDTINETKKTKKMVWILRLMVSIPCDMNTIYSLESRVRCVQLSETGEYGPPDNVVSTLHCGNLVQPQDKVF